MKTISRLGLRLIALALVASAVGCGGGGGDEPPPREEVAKTAENVRQLDSGLSAKRVDDGTFEINANLANLKVGDIAYAKSLAGLPEGLALKIQSVESRGGVTVIKGNNATVLDLYSDFYQEEDNLAILPPAEMRGRENDEFVIPVSWELEDDDGDALRFDGNVRLKLNVDLLIDEVLFDLRACNFEARIKATLEGKLTHVAPVSFGEHKLKVWESPPLGLINFGPLVLVPTLKLNLKAGGKLNIGAGVDVVASIASTWGLEYKNRSWRAYGEADPKLTIDSPVVFANAKGSATLLNPELTLSCVAPLTGSVFLGADLPSFELELEAISNPRSVRVNLDAVFQAEAGVNADFFGAQFKYQTDPFVFHLLPLIDNETTNADGEIGVEIK